jgi:O-antigen/teichoic acid export membrane protein
LSNRAYTIQTVAYLIAGVCFIVVAVLDRGVWTVVLGIIGVVMVVLALWRWYSVSRTAHERT